MINEREKCYTLDLNSKKYVQSEGGECVTRTYDHSNGEAFSTLILNEGIALNIIDTCPRWNSFGMSQEVCLYGKKR